MVLDEMNAMDNPWSFLQQPSHTSSGITASYRSLLAAVDQGWKVAEPVQVLPTTRVDEWIYAFVLIHPSKAEFCRIFVPAVLDVVGYVERNLYPTVYSDGV
jgi:hypothetical protein